MSIRHEYVDSLRPLHPIHLRGDTEYVVTKTTVRRTASGRGPCADDPVVIQYHVYDPFDPRLEDPQVETRSREIGCEWDGWTPASTLLSAVVSNAVTPWMVAKHGDPVARMVLNCMRTNPAARFDNVVPIHAGIEIGEEVDEGPRPAPFAETSPAIRDWQERKAAEAERDRVSWVHNDPYWMNQARRFHGSVFTKFTPKFRFAVSGHPPATKRVWHLVNLDACRTEWRNGEVYAYHVSLWCKGRNDHMVFRPDHNFELGGFLFASLPDERKICAMCPKHREESKNR